MSVKDPVKRSEATPERIAYLNGRACLTPAEAGELVGLSGDTIERLITEGRLDRVPYVTKKLVARTTLLEWVNTRPAARRPRTQQDVAA